MAIDRQEYPYRRGNRYEQLPIPMVAEHCVTVDAGAVQLVAGQRQVGRAECEPSFERGRAQRVKDTWACRPPHPCRRSFRARS